MAEVEQIGNVEKSREEKEIDWKIPDFFSFAEKKVSKRSPRFLFADNEWFMELRCDESRIAILYLINVNQCECSSQYSFGVKKNDGRVQLFFTGIMQRGNTFEYPAYLNVSKVQQQKSELTSLGELTITCTLKLLNTNYNQSNVMLKSRLKKGINAESLTKDYKKVFLHGQNHDLILKIGDREFPVHRDILRARSRVFESMLGHDMKEKNRGVIDIADCDPEAMEQFLLYIYCGKVETLNEGNIFGLYYAADKYDMEILKGECCDFIKKSLSSSNIVEVIQLALDHGDSDLLDCATQYFSDNMQYILRTVEWQTFLKDNSTAANELLIKSVDLKNAKEI